MIFKKNFSSVESINTWLAAKVAAKELQAVDEKKVEAFTNFVKLQDFTAQEQDDKIAFAILKLVKEANNNLKYKKVHLDVSIGDCRAAYLPENNSKGASGESMAVEAYEDYIKACHVLDRKKTVCYVVYTIQDEQRYKNSVIAELNEKIKESEDIFKAADEFEKEKEAFAARVEQMKEDLTFAQYEYHESNSKKRFILENILGA